MITITGSTSICQCNGYDFISFIHVISGFTFQCVRCTATVTPIAIIMIFGFVLENVFVPGAMVIKIADAAANATGFNSFHAADPLGKLSPPMMVNPKKIKIDAIIAMRARGPETLPFSDAVISDTL